VQRWFVGIGIAVISRRQIFAAVAFASAGNSFFSSRRICAIIRSALAASIRISVIWSYPANRWITEDDTAQSSNPRIATHPPAIHRLQLHCQRGSAHLTVAATRAGSVIGIEPADPHCTGMGRAHRPASPVGGGAGGAAIRRDVAHYRESFAAVFGGGFWGNVSKMIMGIEKAAGHWRTAARRVRRLIVIKCTQPAPVWRAVTNRNQARESEQYCSHSENKAGRYSNRGPSSAPRP